MKVGYCHFCKNSRMVETDETDQNILNALATEECDCPGATHQRKLNHEKETAEGIIDEYFTETYPEAAELLKASIEPIQKEKIKNITIQICPKIKAAITKTNKDSLKVSRTFTKKDEMETE